MKIESDKWYPIEQCAAALEVTEDAVARYFRAKKGSRRLSGEKRGPRQKWHAKGRELIDFRKRLNYND
ncbi:hypothetical protein FJY68_03965 [candidate division WOR-3 bacterium]|uniref:Uncharacterized protein n=1 Tax=candidate division WOR-3 bacterium TaxID=2052148 RepID=A0A937XD50_UNCW3|nr:hypothetical protein [candidate division WOR-3 bacterium]